MVQLLRFPAAVVTHAAEPAHDLPVLLLVGGAFVDAQRCAVDIDGGHLGSERRLHVAHGDRQQLVALRFDDAEARGEFHQRRLGVGVDRHRKARGVEEQAARIIFQPGRQSQAQGAAGRQRSRKADAVHVVGPGLVFFHCRLEALGARAGQRGGQRIGAPHRRGEGHAGGQERQAAGFGREPFAGKLGGKVGPRPERQRLVLARGDAVVGRHACAPHQRHFGLGRQRPLALQHHQGQAFQALVGHRRAGAPYHAARLEVQRQIALRKRLALRQYLFALGAGQDAHADFFVDAFGAAPGMLSDIGVAGRRIETEHENLPLVDLRSFVRQHLHHGRPPGIETEAALAGHRLAGQVARIRFDRKAARHAGRQVALEIVTPVAAVDPAALARFGAIDRERVTQAHVAERHHLAAETRRHLAHALDGAGGRKCGDGGLRQCQEWQAAERGGAEEAKQGTHASSVAQLL